MPAIVFNQTHVGLAGLTRLTLMVAIIFLAGASRPAICRDADESVEKLIRQLDSSSYSDREDATQELARIGRPALQPLAAEYFSCSPESAWRIKKVLEYIGTHTESEATSVKAIGILIVLNHPLEDSVTGLLERWRINRSQRARKFLTDKGARVIPFAPPGRNVFFFDRTTVVKDSTAQSKPPTANKKTAAESKQQIDEIIQGTFVENQEFVWSTYDKARPRRSDSTVRRPQVIVQGRVWMNQNGRLEGLSNGRESQVTLEFGDQWQGTPQDFQRISELHDLSGLVFKNRMIEISETKALKELEGLQHLGFSNSRVRGKRLTSIDIPDSVQSVELANMTIDDFVVKWLGSSKATSLLLDNCKINGSAINEFPDLNKVSYLDLKRVRVSGAMLGNLARIARLNYIQMSVCKFDFSEFQEFRARRPQVRVSFQPVAFLGVQGATNADPFSHARQGCWISQVVDDSAASRGGIREGDIVEKVNGNRIDKFEDLRMYISQYEVNDSMQIQILRDGQRIDLEVTLGDISEADLR